MKFNLMQKIRSFKRPTTGQFILMGVGLVVAISLYLFLNGFVACWRLTALPGIAPATCGIQSASPAPVTTNEQGEQVVATATAPSVSAPDANLPDPWDGASRVNILVMGYDYGDWAAERSCPCRTDTMMVLTIDPLSHTAGMLSIPRDMWVSIPGFNSYNKINAANFLGDLYNLPGGGPELARKTVENFLGIPIHYYALVDFQTAEKIVDTIDGICIDVPTKIIIDPLGPHNTSSLGPGRECISGSEALAYARARDVEQGVEGGDVERSAHQQQVIMAIRDKVLENPSVILKAGELYNELSEGVKTNLSLDDALRLAVLAKDIDLGNIQRGVIDYTMMVDAQYNYDGEMLAVLRPYPDKIRALVDQVFGSGAMKPLATGDPTELMRQEAAKVVVVNGSGVDGVAAQTEEYLKAQGMNVIGSGNMDEYPDKYSWPPLSERTMLIVHMGKPYVIQYLMTLMQFTNQYQLVFDFDPNAASDVTLAVGSDWVNSMP